MPNALYSPATRQPLLETLPSRGQDLLPLPSLTLRGKAGTNSPSQRPTHGLWVFVFSLIEHLTFLLYSTLLADYHYCFFPYFDQLL